MNEPGTAPLSPEARAKGRRTLLLLAVVAIAPVIASYSAYYFFPREQRTNYGELLATVPAPALAGTRADGRPFALAQLRGKWVLIVSAPGACDALCARALHATRQARTIQGREKERVQRVWLVTDNAAPDPALLAEHPDLQIARVSPDALGGLPAGVDRIYLVDPLGNLVLAFPGDPDIKKVAKDIERVLRASRIG
jgi:cytochrome oxidase Cu insertion factor (SCO1/SenC/PrrC family)